MKANMEFLTDFLNKNPQATFAEVKKAAPKGMKIYPISYGKAKAMLGLVSSKKKPGRPKGSKNKPRRKTRDRTGLEELEGVLLEVRKNQEENEELKEALVKIRDLVDSTL